MMFYLHSLSGTSLTLWLISWLPSLLVISSCAWILSAAAVKSTKEEWPQLFKPLTTPLLIMMPEMQPKGKRTVYIATMMVILTAILLAGVGLGYGRRDHQLISNERTYWGVTILDSYSPQSFHVQPERMQDYKWDFCSPAPFQKSQVFKFITYEQRNDCKRLEYFREEDHKGEQTDAELSIR
jgi:hypothetical protein